MQTPEPGAEQYYCSVLALHHHKAWAEQKDCC